MKDLSWKFLFLLLISGLLDLRTLSGAPSLWVGLTAGTPGTTAQVAVNYTTDTNAPTLQFDLLYDTNYLVSGTPERGNALSNHTLASSEPYPGVRRILIFSISNSPITNGALVHVPFRIATNAPDHNEPMILSNVVVVNPQADAVPANTMNGILAIAVLPRFISIYPTNDRAVHLTMVGPPGQQYLIQGCRSLDPPQWTSLYTNVANYGRLDFDDVGAAVLSTRFYRASLVR